jgi:hypothetical protein
MLPAEEALIAEVDARDAAKAPAQYIHCLYCCRQSCKGLAAGLPCTAALKTTTTVTTTTTCMAAEAPPNVVNSPHEASLHPNQPSAQPAPSQTDNALIGPSDTPGPNANTATVVSMQDYGRPSPGWEPEDDCGWMDHLMPSLKTIKRTRINAPSTHEIAVFENLLDDMLDVLDFHNTIFRRMAYIGMLLLLCIVICSIAFIERQLDDMLDSLVYPTCIYQAGFCCGLFLSIGSAVYIETYNRHASPRNFVLRYVAWLAVAFDLGLAVFILLLPTIYPG